MLRVLALLLALLAAAPAMAREASPGAMPSVAQAELPREARDTLVLIRRGGPFPHRRDGTVFGNFERRLPEKPRGHYREYTVPTPGARDRGARRIVAGRDGAYYYTDDHYRSFRKIRE